MCSGALEAYDENADSNEVREEQRAKIKDERGREGEKSKKSEVN